jgi:hypothetical protein
MLETVVVVARCQDLFSKFHARLRAKVVLYHRTFDSSRSEERRAREGRGLGCSIRDSCLTAIAVIISP